MVEEGGPGGIERLRELARRHPSEFTYELHTLGYTPDEIGETVDHVLVSRLLDVRLRDTSSWLFAVVNNWEFPVSREWMVAADHFDAFVRSKSGRRKPKPYPRPWKNADATKIGSTKLSPKAARELLRRAREEGVGRPMPTPTYG